MFTNDILPAICRTFLHSIWQGLFVALAGGLVLMLTRRSTARKRYNWLGLLLLTGLIAPIATLLIELGATSPSAAPAPVPTGVDALPATASPVHWWDVLIVYLDVHAPLIMMIWSIVFLFKCFRIGFGLFQIGRIRTRGLQAAGEEWNTKVDELSAVIGIQKAVRLWQSKIVRVPLTTGFLRPCIFVPLGLLAQLPADQAEAIILHELAHIRRNDYLVNMLQSFAECIFFFNPGLLWLSARLREEREACCDDIVVAHMPQQASYLHALVSFATTNAGPHNRLELAIIRKQHSLLNRIRRLLTKENQMPSITERLIFASGLLLIFAFTLAPDPSAPSPQEYVVYKPMISPAPVFAIHTAQRSDTTRISRKPAPTDTVPVRRKTVVRDTVHRVHYTRDSSRTRVFFVTDSGARRDLRNEPTLFSKLKSTNLDSLHTHQLASKLKSTNLDSLRTHHLASKLKLDSLRKHQWNHDKIRLHDRTFKADSNGYFHLKSDSATSLRSGRKVWIQSRRTGANPPKIVKSVRWVKRDTLYFRRPVKVRSEPLFRDTIRVLPNRKEIRSSDLPEGVMNALILPKQIDC
ncbi:M56 family metallopeptidase [Chitinophaga lutea]